MTRKFLSVIAMSSIALGLAVPVAVAVIPTSASASPTGSLQELVKATVTVDQSIYEALYNNGGSYTAAQAKQIGASWGAAAGAYRATHGGPWVKDVQTIGRLLVTSTRNSDTQALNDTNNMLNAEVSLIRN